MFFAWLNGNGSSAGGYNPRLGVPIKPGLLYPPPRSVTAASAEFSTTTCWMHWTSSST